MGRLSVFFFEDEQVDVDVLFERRVVEDDEGFERFDLYRCLDGVSFAFGAFVVEDDVIGFAFADWQRAQEFLIVAGCEEEALAVGAHTHRGGGHTAAARLGCHLAF